MLIGGMFDVDTAAAEQNETELDFPIRSDIHGRYSRKVYTNNGRTATTYAFKYGMRLQQPATVLMPEYCCVSCINALEASNVNFVFYKVGPGLIIDTRDLESKITNSVKVLYVIHYFGIPQPAETVAEIRRIAREHHLYILEDLTQTVHSKSEHEERIGFGDYLVMSTRKWYPMTDGGIVAARDDVPFEIAPMEQGYDEAVFRQMRVVLERKYYEADPARDINHYLELEKEANRARYYDFTPKAMTALSRNVLASADHAESIRRRRENYIYLHEALQNVPGLTVWSPALDEEGEFVPFGFVVTVDDRDGFYQYLAEHGIIGEKQWILPTEYYEPSEYAAFMGDHSLMLQCDQRYGIPEMERTVQVIQDYCKAR